MHWTTASVITLKQIKRNDGSDGYKIILSSDWVATHGKESNR